MVVESPKVRGMSTPSDGGDEDWSGEIGERREREGSRRGGDDEGGSGHDERCGWVEERVRD